jgi:hypothetical protein
MTRHTLLSAIGLILALAAPAAQAPTPLALGIVRADGILVPVAVFENGAWVEAWTEPAHGTKLDGMIMSLPNYWRQRRTQTPQVWHVPRRGMTAARAEVLTLVIFDEHCGQQVGLLTDLPSRKADSHEKHLAADRVIPIVLPVDLSAPGRVREGWGDLMEAAQREIARQEAAAIAMWEQQSSRTSQLEPLARRKAVRIKTLHAYRADGVRLLYYEAERQYANPIWKRPTAEASALSAAGWIHDSTTTAPQAFEGRAVITDMDHKEVVTMVPLGVVQAGGARFWVTQAHGYESEGVNFYRFDEDGMRLAFSRFIGGC